MLDGWRVRSVGDHNKTVSSAPSSLGLVFLFSNVMLISSANCRGPLRGRHTVSSPARTMLDHAMHAPCRHAAWHDKTIDIS